MTQTVVLASGNAGKLIELQDALASAPFTLKPQSAFGVDEAVENMPTFIENALIKARHAATCTGYPAIADDSGLVVPALNGAPGIYSSRYSGEGDAANNRKLLSAMSALSGSERNAYFFCILVFLRSADDPSPLFAEGRWHGRIATSLRGEGGFGYDPLFEVQSGERTAAMLSLEEKRRLSHRGQAVSALSRQLSD